MDSVFSVLPIVYVIDVVPGEYSFNEEMLPEAKSEIETIFPSTDVICIFTLPDPLFKTRAVGSSFLHLAQLVKNRVKIVRLKMKVFMIETFVFIYKTIDNQR